MPLRKLKKTYDYCLSNKKNLIIILVLILFSRIFSNYNLSNGILDNISFLLSLILSVIILGYGLEVTYDLIHDGNHLPHIQLKQSIPLGIKFVIVNGAYLITQILILGLISTALDFPVFELEESILHPDEIINLFFSHDILFTAFFIIISATIAYIFTFFMEIGLAKLADGGKLIDAFNFKEIKGCIDIIG